SPSPMPWTSSANEKPRMLIDETEDVDWDSSQSTDDLQPVNWPLRPQTTCEGGAVEEIGDDGNSFMLIQKTPKRNETALNQ
ncbi:hypothetical protein BGX27_003554, partial [Mortierella sp. AM989]